MWARYKYSNVYHISRIEGGSVTQRTWNSHRDSTSWKKDSQQKELMKRSFGHLMTISVSVHAVVTGGHWPLKEVTAHNGIFRLCKKGHWYKSSSHEFRWDDIPWESNKFQYQCALEARKTNKSIMSGCASHQSKNLISQYNNSRGYPSKRQKNTQTSPYYTKPLCQMTPNPIQVLE